jgi:nitroreductase
LGGVMAQSLRNSDPNVSDEAVAKDHAKPLRAPVVIAVAVDKPNLPKVVEIENVCAAAAAVQNMLLAAHALELGAYWRTGPAATDPAIKTFLGFAPDQHLLGFIYIGYPDMPPHPPSRPSFEDRTVWLG